MSTTPLEITIEAPCPPAPLSGWRRLLVDWLLVSGTTVLCQVLGVIGSLALRVCLSPAQMGVWQGLKLMLANGNYANLGISKGAAREYTIALGRGTEAEAQRGLNMALTVNTLSSGLFGLALVGSGIGLACYGGGAWGSAWAWGLIALGCMAVVQRYLTFQITLLRCKQDFVITSQLSVLEALLTVSVATLGAWLWGLPGLYVGTLIVLVASVLFVHVRGAIPLAWAWDFGEIRRLTAIGCPILLVGVVSTLFRTLDRWMILGYLPDREFQLGCYSLALLVTGQLYGLGNILSIVVAPRLGEHFGRDGDRRQAAALTARSSELQAAVLALPAALAIVAVPPLLGTLLPDYRPGLAPMLWQIPGILALGLALLPGQYLISVDRQKWSLAAIVLATGVSAGACHVALVTGFGLIGVAAASSLSYVVYLLLAAAPVWWELNTGARLRCLAMHGLALGPALLAALGLEALRPSDPGQWSIATAKVLAVLLAWGLSLAAGWQLGGWREAIQSPRHRPA